MKIGNWTIFEKRSQTIDKWLAEAIVTGRKSGVNSQSLLYLPTVWRCIEIISTSIAGLPVCVKKESTDRVERIPHTIDRLLRVKANSYMSAHTWKELVIRDVVTRGDHFSLIVRNGSTPIELLPCAYDDVDVKLIDGQIYYFIGKQKETFMQDDVLHIKGASADGVRGMSMIEFHRRSFSTGLSSSSYIKEFFENNATPKGILSYPNAIKPEVAKSTREAWHKLYGTGGKYSVAVLDGGAEFKTISLPPADAMYLEVAKYTDKQICNIYGVPMHMVNDLSDAHYNNIESSGIELVKYTLMSWINRLESEMNRKLLREVEQLDHFVDFDANGLMRGDMKARADYYQILRQNRILSANEARRMEGLNPYEGGDVYDNPNIDTNKNESE